MKKELLLVGTALVLALSGCGNDKSNEQEPKHEEMDHGSHSSSSEVPKGLKESVDATYPVGSKAIITTGHMEGMEGAEATIVGAYDTTVYTISYTPTTGGEKVEDHKWVIHEEIKDAGSDPLEPGATVTIDADHMEGMKDATATIDSAKQTTVYMVDYMPTNDGEEVKNHKWVTESELSPE